MEPPIWRELPGSELAKTFRGRNGARAGRTTPGHPERRADASASAKAPAISSNVVLRCCRLGISSPTMARATVRVLAAGTRATRRRSPRAAKPPPARWIAAPRADIGGACVRRRSSQGITGTRRAPLRLSNVSARPHRAIRQSRDPYDDKFLECAVAGGADYVVSADADLLSLGEVRGIPIVNASLLAGAPPVGVPGTQYRELRPDRSRPRPPLRAGRNRPTPSR